MINQMRMMDQMQTTSPIDYQPHAVDEKDADTSPIYDQPDADDEPDADDHPHR